MFGELSLAASALAGEIAIIETAPRARQTIAQSSATFLVGFIVSPRFVFCLQGTALRHFPPQPNLSYPCDGPILIHKHCPVNLRRSSPLK